ncbi:MAG: alpha/beta hydrolase [Bacteroidales bacterium]|nr:alpha/beta hydrolase [Bacteroidales bacterium]
MSRSLILTAILGATLASNFAFAQSVESKLERISRIGTNLKPSETVLLYPEGVQAALKNKKGLDPKIGNGYGDGEAQERDEEARKNGFIAYVSDSARIDLYFPENPNGQMVLSTPGGSYKDLSSWNEGVYVAEWMLKRGITVGVVKYRLPNGHWEVPLTDVQNAFRYCRAHASDWGVKQIGVIGFSAGGHLATTVETMYVDSLTRPDFAVVIYPVVTFQDGITHKNTRGNLIGFDNTAENYAELQKRYSSENNVTSDTPQTFIALSSNDGLVPATNSLLFARALAEAGVSVELHMYPKGGHGWGFTDKKIAEASGTKDNLGSCRKDFSNALERWLKEVRKKANL